ncbi:GntR family transcriptional regulator [Pelagibius sp.]|uniref:GntR family transcriptional regulator n=1 Tax=Pelagibius sp. TaxID=1931238 RepID=UPI003B50A5E1
MELALRFLRVSPWGTAVRRTCRKERSDMQHSHTEPDDRSVYEQIKELLVTYAFLPGDRLHVPELADQLRVSATPVREALNRFCAESLLTAVPHRGFFVKRLDQAEIADLFGMKYMMLDYAASGTIAGLRLDDGERRALATIAGLDKEDEDLPERLRVYERYAVPMTLLIASLSQNAALLECLRNVLDRLHFVRLTEIAMEDRAETILKEAAAISQGLLAGSEAAVKRGLEEQHLREQRMLPELMKECVNRLYLRCRPAPQSSERSARLVMVTA